jgi:hypothetical protein
VEIVKSDEKYKDTMEGVKEFAELVHNNLGERFPDDEHRQEQ